MEPTYLKILEKFKNKSAGVFIDDANLFYIQKKIGWKINWLKVKEFLGKYLNLNLLHYYLGMPAKGKGLIENERIKEELEKIGFKVITKPLKKIYLNSQK